MIFNRYNRYKWKARLMEEIFDRDLKKVGLWKNDIVKE